MYRSFTQLSLLLLFSSYETCVKSRTHIASRNVYYVVTRVINYYSWTYWFLPRNLCVLCTHVIIIRFGWAHHFLSHCANTHMRKQSYFTSTVYKSQSTVWEGSKVNFTLWIRCLDFPRLNLIILITKDEDEAEDGWAAARRSTKNYLIIIWCHFRFAWWDYKSTLLGVCIFWKTICN